MIERRAFVTALGMSLCAVPARVLAQPAPRVPRVGYLFSFTLSAGRQLWEACRQGLRDLGYAEGRTIIRPPRRRQSVHRARRSASSTSEATRAYRRADAWRDQAEATRWAARARAESTASSGAPTDG